MEKRYSDDNCLSDKELENLLKNSFLFIKQYNTLKEHPSGCSFYHIPHRAARLFFYALFQGGDAECPRISV